MNRVNPAAAAAVPEVRRLLQAGKVAEAEALADKAMISIPRRMPPYQTLGDLTLTFAGHRRARRLLAGRSTWSAPSRPSRIAASGDAVLAQCLCVGSRSGRSSFVMRAERSGRHFVFRPAVARGPCDVAQRRPRHAAARRAGVAAKERAASAGAAGRRQLHRGRARHRQRRPGAHGGQRAARRGGQGSAAADRRRRRASARRIRPPPA